MTDPNCNDHQSEKRLRELQQLQVNRWNAAHPDINLPVTYVCDDYSVVVTTTQTKADVLGGHTAVIWLKGVSGAVALERVKPAPRLSLPPHSHGKTTLELIAMLQALPPEAAHLEVIVSSQGETVQIPLEAQIEAVCEEDPEGNSKDIVRLYTDNGERD